MLDTIVNETLQQLAPLEFCDKVTLKGAVEANTAGDVVKEYFTLINDSGSPLTALNSRYIPKGSVVNRSQVPNTVTEVSRIIILGKVTNFNESSLVILNDKRTFRIVKIISNNQHLTVLEVEDIAI